MGSSSIQISLLYSCASDKSYVTFHDHQRKWYKKSITHYCGVGITYHNQKSKESRLEKLIKYAIRRQSEMVAEKSGPSFASTLTILSIVMYTGGFLRLEVEFNKQKDKINQLESVVESMKTSKGDDIAQGKLVWEIA